MDTIFQWCVDVLMIMAQMTGTTYREINVIIFCVIEPLIALGLLGYIVHLKRCLRAMKNEQKHWQQSRSISQQ